MLKPDDSTAYICDIIHDDVRSEGMSYGMMIAVQFEKKDIFDRLWRWTKTYMQHKEGASKVILPGVAGKTGVISMEGRLRTASLFITSLILLRTCGEMIRVLIIWPKLSIYWIVPWKRWNR